MSIFGNKESNAIKITKVDNGYSLSTYITKKDSFGEWDKLQKDLVFADIDGLVAKIREVWTS